MISPKLNDKIVEILKQRFSEEDGEEQFEDTHEQAELFLTMGMFQAAKGIYERLLQVDSEDLLAQEALQEIERSLH